jgi:hypothetical protein
MKSCNDFAIKQLLLNIQDGMCHYQMLDIVSNKEKREHLHMEEDLIMTITIKELISSDLIIWKHTMLTSLNFCLRIYLKFSTRIKIEVLDTTSFITPLCRWTLTPPSVSLQMK